MRTLAKFGGALVVVVLLLLTLRVTGFEPKECPNAGVSWTCRVPGLWLKGDVVTTPVADWSFTDRYQTIKVLTRHWNENVSRDPHVRIKIGTQLFDQTLAYVTDSAERAAVILNKAKKYPKQIIGPKSVINVFHVMPNDERVTN